MRERRRGERGHQLSHNHRYCAQYVVICQLFSQDSPSLLSFSLFPSKWTNTGIKLTDLFFFYFFDRWLSVGTKKKIYGAAELSGIVAWSDSNRHNRARLAAIWPETSYSLVFRNGLLHTATNYSSSLFIITFQSRSWNIPAQGVHAMQSHARSRYPSQLCIRRIRELAIESQVIQNTGLTARGYHIHGSGQEPVKDFHGSPDLVSYGPPVASRQNVGLGFFFF